MNYSIVLKNIDCLIKVYHLTTFRYCVEMVEELSERMKFDYKLILPTDGSEDYGKKLVQHYCKKIQNSIEETYKHGF